MVVSPLAANVAKVLFAPLAKRLPDLLLGPKAERELAKCVERAIHGTVDELGISGARLESLTLILDEIFSRPLNAISSDIWTPSDGSLSVLIRDQAIGRIAVLDDADITGVGTSSLELLGVDAEALGDALTRQILNEIIRQGVEPESPLYLLAGIVRDEILHNELLAAISGLRAELHGLLPPGESVTGTGAVSLIDRHLVVPDGTHDVVVRLAVTNTSGEQQRLRRLVILVAESRPSEIIRLKQAGAPLQEYDLAVDLREVSATDALKGAPHQFVLRPGDSEAFRITVTVSEGTRYKLVIHPEFESIPARTVTEGVADHLTVDYPLQSIESLKRAGLL